MRTAQDNHFEDRIEINDQSLIYCSNGSGEVLDISMKGLSFLHLTGSDWPRGAFKVDLLLDNSTLLIEQIPCSLISPETSSPDDANRWRHALEFGPLSEDQQTKLQEFIAYQRNHRSTRTTF
jgi:hypothetical protein